jgi:hypothetical protein
VESLLQQQQRQRLNCIRLPQASFQLSSLISFQGSSAQWTMGSTGADLSDAVDIWEVRFDCCKRPSIMLHATGSIYTFTQKEITCCVQLCFLVQMLTKLSMRAATNMSLQVFWCYDGWHAAANMLEQMLPPWARLKRINPQQPLQDQVAHAKVLIPTNGLVNAAVIAAAPELRLIAQPAAGYANIDLQAAKQQGVPVTRAPGEFSRVDDCNLSLILQ